MLFLSLKIPKFLKIPEFGRSGSTGWGPGGGVILARSCPRYRGPGGLNVYQVGSCPRVEPLPGELFPVGSCPRIIAWGIVPSGELS